MEALAGWFFPSVVFLSWRVPSGIRGALGLLLLPTEGYITPGDSLEGHGVNSERPAPATLPSWPVSPRRKG